MVRITGFPPVGFLNSTYAEKTSFQTQEEDGSATSSSTFDPLPIILTFTIAGAFVVAVGVVCACRKRDLLSNCMPTFMRHPSHSPGTNIEMGAKPATPHTYENAPPATSLPAEPAPDSAAMLKTSVKRKSQREFLDNTRQQIPRRHTVGPSQKSHYENIPDKNLAASLQLQVQPPSQIGSSGADRQPIPPSSRRFTVHVPAKSVAGPSTPYGPFGSPSEDRD